MDDNEVCYDSLATVECMQMQYIQICLIMQYAYTMLYSLLESPGLTI